MNKVRISWLLVIGGGGLVGLILAVGAALLMGLTKPGINSRYSSNGEQIYFTGTSQNGTLITADMNMGMMANGMMTCAFCHGSDGRGGQVQMMMRTFEAPDIRYKTLTSPEHVEEDEMEHETFTEETIKQAITDGVEPNGEPLDWPMPRWSMSDEDLDDLIVFLMTFD